MNNNRQIIHCLGISYRTAPVEIREKFGLVTDELARHLDQQEGLLQIGLLSTCNRMELYAIADSDDRAPLVDTWARLCDATPIELEDCLYHYTEEEAAEHLFRVSAGLDSMVLGEAQILGQVASSFEAAQAKRLMGPLLADLFRSAIRAGKRSRTETNIGRNSLSVSSVAVRHLKREMGADDHQPHVLIIGAGEMARLALKTLTNQGVSRITVVNRTVPKAKALADKWGIEYAPLDVLDDLLCQVDGVISAVSTAIPILQPDMEWVSKRIHPLAIADLGVPRNVSEDLNSFPLIHVANMDDLQAVVQDGYDERLREVPKVEAIVSEELDQFEQIKKGHTVRPVISELRTMAEDIRLQELERVYRNLGDVDEVVLKQFDHLSRSIINKLLHQPTKQLRTKAEAGQGDALAEATKTLFQIETD